MSSAGLQQAFSLRQRAGLLSSRFGVFSKVLYNPILQSGRPFFIASVYTNFSEERRNWNIGSGISTDSREALAIALGEGIERLYSTNLGQRQILENASYSELLRSGRRALNPADLRFFSRCQYEADDFGVSPWTEETSLDWIAARDPLTQNQIWVPAFLGFFDYGVGSRFGSSNGLACSESFEGAALSAVLELVERDAFMFSWWTKTPLVRVDLANSRRQSREWKVIRSDFGAWLDKVEMGFTCLDHGIPVFIARCKGEWLGNARGVVLAASAKLNPIDGVRKTLLELFVSCEKFFSKRLELANQRRFGQDFNATIRDFSDNIDFYLQAGHEGLTDFLFTSAYPPLDVDDLPNLASGDVCGDFETVLRKLAAINAGPLIVDLSSRPVRSCGLSVVRAISPTLLSINPEHRYRFWGQERLFTLGEKLGLTDRRLDLSDLNPWPHAFP